ncbi:zinc finger, C3HC4 type (RING finger) protein (macronuclear) [Tetrahymena thermophila SB210]|uniref:Zinc finger, C3HC4 type (RING finger) protein n=1 Tax=Tetrahymena thermophila (strain SB210) TaxID=312017 RepID=Q23DC7_TETTS|nr:zinc finger, C3HC4 type (RING finger) protein [Tetrahymena thermophila SB210]EAR94656.2 zinc finger, C3HC4 type (RING finger) protein [Tetrahymena thermophila SB210]|eukprot:XP_001014759.2 zinc finger, C3HC4 type (RING finger) protein [Tetrahymena thermophila SB210]
MMQSLNLETNADKFLLLCLITLCCWVLLAEFDQLIKNCLVVLLVSKLYKLDERINKDVDAYFNSIFSMSIPIKKLVCFFIIVQKKICHIILLNQLYCESVWRFIELAFWSEKMQFVTILCNGFASHYFMQGFLEGKFWVPFLVPLLCLGWNIYLVLQSNFLSSILWPAVILVFLFLFCYAIIAYFLNFTYTFQTTYMSDIAAYIEQLGSFHLAVQVLKIFSAGQFSLQLIGGPCMTIICVNFTVGACHYPEQFFIKSLAQSYQQDDCAICLDKLDQKPAITITLTGCFHFFHVDCLDSWTSQKKKTCPLCRTFIEDDDDDNCCNTGNQNNSQQYTNSNSIVHHQNNNQLQNPSIQDQNSEIQSNQLAVSQ